MWRSAVKKDLYPLLRLVLPLALTSVVGSSVFFFETLFLAHLSTEVLAAGALVSWLFGTFAVILFGTLSSVNVLVAHKCGANDPLGISQVLRDGLILAVLLAIPAMFLFWNMAPVFLIFGQTPTIVLLAKSYLHALSFGILPNFITLVLLQFIMGLGHTRSIIIFTLCSVLLNIFFSYAFIFGKLGLPALGIAGAGWGMTISYWITALILASYVLVTKRYKIYVQSIFNRRKPCFLLELLQLGLPMGVMYCFEVGFFFAMTLLMGSLSSQMLAANQIAMQYMSTLMAVIFSIAQAITIRMGHLLGAKQIHSAERACYAGLYISGAFMGMVAICYWIFPGLLISVDLDASVKNLEIIHYAEQLFAVSAVFQIVESIRISLFGALRSLMDTRFTLFTSIISFWCIALPVGYLLAMHFHLGGSGFWWGMVIGASCSVFLLYRRFKIKIKYFL